MLARTAENKTTTKHIKVENLVTTFSSTSLLSSFLGLFLIMYWAGLFLIMYWAGQGLYELHWAQISAPDYLSMQTTMWFVNTFFPVIVFAVLLHDDWNTPQLNGAYRRPNAKPIPMATPPVGIDQFHGWPPFPGIATPSTVSSETSRSLDYTVTWSW